MFTKLFDSIMLKIKKGSIFLGGTMFLEITLGIAALAFTALMIYLIIVLRSLKTTLDLSAHTLIIVNDIAEDVNIKLQSFDGVFEAVEMVGDKLRDVNDRTSNRSEERSKNKVAALLEWLTLGATLWMKFRK